ncbi:hypothetical protein [Brevundimonas sp. FT23042]|uniref:hypothetical protein n=1 Tax=Brevundimonas sp. FT23042 TaxID=3393749 RepID=UPI003B58B1FA
MTTPAQSSAPSPVRPWMIGAGVTVVLAAGLSLALMRGDPSGAVAGSPMTVEVVAPVEPVVDPGTTMEVGPLVDGYTHVDRPAPSDPADAYDADYQTAWVEPLPPLPEPRRVRVDLPTEGPMLAPTAPQPARAGGAYGFDTPGPDYAAERRARQDRLDRIQAEQAFRGRGGTPVGGPTLDRDTAFY